MLKPLKRGDAQDVVVDLSLSLESLEFILYALPQGDDFTRDLWKIHEEVLVEVESERAWRESQPGLRIGLNANGEFRMVVVHPPTETTTSDRRADA